uniref:hypothetical protein n=1 Tax=Falsiroseomonas oryziterrae TaxID=2911368 RepID=UPI001F32DC9B
AITSGTITANAPGGGVLVPAGAALDAPAGRIVAGAAATSRIGAPDRLSARTTVQRGANIRADGGEVIVHSSQRTAMSGTITARGGQVEVSSRRALAIDGRVDVGPTGRVLVDPEELRIVDSLSGSTEPAEVTADFVNTTPGLLELTADRTIRVQAEVNRTEGPLTLETLNATAAPGEGIFIEAPLAVLGDLRLISAGDITQSDGARLSVGTLFAESRAGAVRLEAFDNAILALDGGRAATRFDVLTSTSLAVDAPVTAAAIRLTASGDLRLNATLDATAVELVGQAGITQSAGGAITAGTLALEANFGAIALDGAANTITALADVTAPAGIALRNAGALTVSGTLNAAGATATLRVDAGDLSQDANARILAEALRVAAPAGSVRLDAAQNVVARLSGSARDDLAVETTGALRLDGEFRAARISLGAGDIAQETGALVITPRLSLRAAGSVFLDDPLNEVQALGASTADAVLSLATSTDLSIEGHVAAPLVRLLTAGSLRQGAGSIGAMEARLTALTSEIRLDGAGNDITTLDSAFAAGALAVAATGALELSGALDAGGPATIEAASLTLSLLPVTAPSVTLRGTGDITQAGGRIETAALRAEGANVTLDSAGNSIAAVAGRGATFRVTTAGALAPDDIAATNLSLAAASIAQPATGMGISADLLDATTTGRIDLAAQANAIRALGTVTAPGGLVLATTTPLELTRPVTVPEASFATGGDLTQSATLSAGTLRVASAGAVLLEDPANAIPRLLGAEATGAIRLVTSGALALDGDIRAPAVSLAAQDSITQAAGAIDTPSLVARSVLGAVTLAGANRLDALGGGAAGDFTLRQDAPADLRLEGLVAAPSVTLILAGGLSDAAGALRTDALALDAAGAVALDAGGTRVA